MDARQKNYEGVFDGQIGFGKTPAIIVIDFIKAYTTPGSPFYCEGVVHAVSQSVDLLAAARDKNVPIIYTQVFFQRDGFDGGLFVKKVPALKRLVAGEPLADIDPKLTPRSNDIIVTKNYASVFFGTSLASTLTANQIDTVILIGCSTSGCVRASAIDGIQHGFRVIVPRECVGDRMNEMHEANLFDINAKYGDVVSKAQTIDYLKSL
ncbi:MAG: isochorismatase family protein [Burkholderiaceae bacterium]|nr:isochorismatase family protein [Burkholderiaceae bacterium]MCD8538050.1 isochorismatase family protein [Burkholderiaceae bacterium]MCD8565407.1 isochorismatase family protein [Burkholderiaceae bacterium]